MFLVKPFDLPKLLDTMQRMPRPHVSHAWKRKSAFVFNMKTDVIKRVLVLEDNLALGDLLVTMLKRSGFDVILARTAEDIFTLSDAEKASVSVMIVDLSLPGPRNGFSIARGLLAEYPHMKIIFTSGFSMEELGESSLIEGKNFLQKPFIAPQLIAMVREELSSGIS